MAGPKPAVALGSWLCDPPQWGPSALNALPGARWSSQGAAGEQSWLLTKGAVCLYHL